MPTRCFTAANSVAVPHRRERRAAGAPPRAGLDDRVAAGATGAALRRRAAMPLLRPERVGHAAARQRRVGEHRHLDRRDRVEAPLLDERRRAAAPRRASSAGSRAAPSRPGTFTRHGKSAPARSATASRMRPQDARPVLERAAELVGAPVVERRQELVEQLRVGRAELDAVVARLARPRRDVAVPRGHRAHLVGGQHVHRHASRTRAAAARGTGDAASTGPARVAMRTARATPPSRTGRRGRAG